MRILLLCFCLILPISASPAEENQQQSDLEQFKEWSEVFTSLIELAQTLEQKEIENTSPKENAHDSDQSDQIMAELIDPEDGTIKRLFDFIMRMINEERARKEQQANALDKKIKFIVSNVKNLGVSNAKLQLATIKWQPIGSKKIDSEMSAYYQELTTSIIKQLDTLD